MTNTTSCGAQWTDWPNTTPDDTPTCNRPTNHDGPHYDTHRHARWGNTTQMGITT